MNFRIQERPNMPGDDGGDALIFSDDPDWGEAPDRHKSWSEAWAWLGGNLLPGDVITVLEPDNRSPGR
jgi:hypothetical protein